MFANNCFAEGDVRRLADLLADRYQVSVAVYASRGWNIRINAGRNGEIDRFWQAIAPHVVPVMRYKSPERYRTSPYQPYPAGIHTLELKSATVVNVARISVARRAGSDARKWFPHGRRGLDIKTTTGNYFAKGVLVHNSLGVLYRRPDGFAIATRGTFASPQALWATQHLRTRYDLSALPDDVTLLFEIVYPDNPEGPILRYGATADLFLIGARRFDGHDAPYNELRALSDQFGFPLVPLDAEGDHFEHVGRLIERGATAQGIEGWVIRLAEGFRVKAKTDEYLALARLVSHLTPGHVRDLLMNDPAGLESYILLLPDEFQREGRRLADAITAQYDAELARHERNLAEIVSLSGGNDRKAFAAAVLARYPADAKYLFALHDDKGIRAMILRALDLSALEATTPKFGEDS